MQLMAMTITVITCHRSKSLLGLSHPSDYIFKKKLHDIKDAGAKREKERGKKEGCLCVVIFALSPKPEEKHKKKIIMCA